MNAGFYDQYAIPGNEEVDEEAKEAANGLTSNPSQSPAILKKPAKTSKAEKARGEKAQMEERMGTIP